MNNFRNTLNVKKEFDFQKKIQQQFAKKMEIKNQEHSGSATAPIKTEGNSKNIYKLCYCLLEDFKNFA